MEFIKKIFRKTSNSLDPLDVVQEGWLLLLPPSDGIKLFVGYHWRWFVLKFTIPASFVLEYYHDATCQKKKGSVNLMHCMKIEAGRTFGTKEHKCMNNMFIIKTTKRILGLVGETETETAKWVVSICSVCGVPPSYPSGRKGYSLERGFTDTTKEEKSQNSSSDHNKNKRVQENVYILLSECYSNKSATIDQNASNTEKKNKVLENNVNSFFNNSSPVNELRPSGRFYTSPDLRETTNLYQNIPPYDHQKLESFDNLSSTSLTTELTNNSNIPLYENFEWHSLQQRRANTIASITHPRSSSPLQNRNQEFKEKTERPIPPSRKTKPPKEIVYSNVSSSLSKDFISPIVTHSPTLARQYSKGLYDVPPYPRHVEKKFNTMEAVIETDFLNGNKTEEIHVPVEVDSPLERVVPLQSICIPPEKNLITSEPIYSYVADLVIDSPYLRHEETTNAELSERELKKPKRTESLYDTPCKPVRISENSFPEDNTAENLYCNIGDEDMDREYFRISESSEIKEMKMNTNFDNFSNGHSETDCTQDFRKSDQTNFADSVSLVRKDEVPSISEQVAQVAVYDFPKSHVKAFLFDQVSLLQNQSKKVNVYDNAPPGRIKTDTNSNIGLSNNFKDKESSLNSQKYSCGSNSFFYEASPNSRSFLITPPVPPRRSSRSQSEGSENEDIDKGNELRPPVARRWVSRTIKNKRNLIPCGANSSYLTPSPNDSQSTIAFFGANVEYNEQAIYEVLPEKSPNELNYLDLDFENKLSPEPRKRETVYYTVDLIKTQGLNETRQKVEEFYRNT